MKNHVHCGIKLTTDKTTVKITKESCRKGRGIMLSLQHCGIGKLLPLTLVKLYKAIVLPSSLFGCELWTNLSETEYKMLERMQRFCAKYVQNLGRSTRSDMCVPMLGLMPIQAYIDKAQLGFLRRVCMAPNNSTSKKVFFQRYFQHTVSLENNSMSSGLGQKMHSLLKKYNLLDMFENTYLKNGIFVSKNVWKNVCEASIWDKAKFDFYNRVGTDNDFKRFIEVHHDISKPSALWITAKESRCMSKKSYKIAKIICRKLPDTVQLCEFCGRKYEDIIEHLCCLCSKSESLREQFWTGLTNDFDIKIAVYLYNLDDEQFTNTLLGAPLHIDLNIETLKCVSSYLMDFIYCVTEEM